MKSTRTVSGFGERLAQERRRLGLTQIEMATAGGVGQAAQSRYELEKTAPDAFYLHAFAQAGGDVLYVITGDEPSAAEASWGAAPALLGLETLLTPSSMHQVDKQELEIFLFGLGRCELLAVASYLIHKLLSNGTRTDHPDTEPSHGDG